MKNIEELTDHVSKAVQPNLLESLVHSSIGKNIVRLKLELENSPPTDALRDCLAIISALMNKLKNAILTFFFNRSPPDAPHVTEGFSQLLQSMLDLKLDCRCEGKREPKREAPAYQPKISSVSEKTRRPVVPVREGPKIDNSIKLRVTKKIAKIIL